MVEKNGKEFLITLLENKNLQSVIDKTRSRNVVLVLFLFHSDKGYSR